MKGTKSAKKKVDLSTISSALKGEALKAKMPKNMSTKKTKSAAAPKKRMSTKSAKSLNPSTALTTKSDPTYSGEVDYEKNMKTNIDKIMKKSESAEKKLMDSADTLKSKVKKFKKKKFEDVKNGQ